MHFERDQIKTNCYTTNYRVAVDLLIGQGCERSELPCLSGAYNPSRPQVLFFLHLPICSLVNRRICEQMLLTNDIVFSHWFPRNKQFKRKKTKTFGLVLLTYYFGRVDSRCSQPCPTKRLTATRQLAKRSSLIPNSRSWLGQLKNYHTQSICLDKNASP